MQPSPFQAQILNLGIIEKMSKEYQQDEQPILELFISFISQTSMRILAMKSSLTRRRKDIPEHGIPGIGKSFLTPYRGKKDRS